MFMLSRAFVADIEHSMYPQAASVFPSEQPETPTLSERMVNRV